MKKIIIPLLFIITALGLISLVSAGRTDFELKINDEMITFSNPPLSSGSTLMLPIDETLAHFGALPKWRDEGKMMSCLYNNNFCKLTLGKPSILINGLEEEYEAAPTRMNGAAYAPLSFFCNFLVLNSNQTDTLIEIKSRDTTLSTLFGSTAFLEKLLPHTEIRMALPQAWQQLTENAIGVSNPYESYSFELNIVPTYTRFNANAYIAELISSTQKDLETRKYKMDNMESSYYSTNDHMFDVFNYSTTKKEEKDEKIVKNEVNKETPSNNNPGNSEETKDNNPNRTNEGGANNTNDSKNTVKDKPIHHSHYILIHEGSLYDFHFKHNKLNAKNHVVKDFENTLKTLRLNKNTLNTYYEHYYEDDAFYDYGLKLSSSIYSNMEIKDYILLEGSLNAPDIRELKVTVTKDGELYEYPIEIKANGEFSSLVYSPFGVGKHNFTVYINTPTGKRDLLKFSALNISGTDIAYTIPSEKILSNSAETRELLNLILEEAGKNRAYSSDYSVASTVYDYLKNIIVKTGIDPDSARDLAFDEINFNEKISEKEAAIFFCSLMRAAGIPCRIMQGENREIARTFTSCYINGNWFVYDPASEYYRLARSQTNKESENYIPELRYPATKHLSLEHYNEIFEKMIELEY